MLSSQQHEGESAATLYPSDRRKMFTNLLASIRCCRTETYTLWDHSIAVAATSLRLAVALGLPRETCQLVYLGGLLHDVGKTASCAVTLFKPGPLTPSERKHIQMHPVTGARMVNPLGIGIVEDAVHCHHELFDGSGYPFGLKGRSIPQPARIVAVADYYEALRECRPYRPVACTHSEALAIVTDLARQEKLDPSVARFLNSVTGKGRLTSYSKIFQMTDDFFDKIF